MCSNEPSNIFASASTYVDKKNVEDHSGHAKEHFIHFIVSFLKHISHFFLAMFECKRCQALALSFD